MDVVNWFISESEVWKTSYSTVAEKQINWKLQVTPAKCLWSAKNCC